MKAWAITKTTMAMTGKRDVEIDDESRMALEEARITVIVAVWSI